jgi:peptidyl-prolyl cis-trans isomerase C
MPSRLIFNLLRSFFVTACLLTAMPVWGQQGADDKVVAEVEGAKIYYSNIVAAYNSLSPTTQQAGFDALFPEIRERLIQQMIVLKRGREANLLDNPNVQQRLEAARSRIIHDFFLEQEIKARLSEAELQAEYDKWLLENPPRVEVRARHILVETEQEAMALIQRIGAGEAFADLAQEASIGPSASRGGDLGYFTRDRMVKPFADVAFALQPNQYSSNPVKTQYGWHVVLVEDRREGTQPTFEQMRPELISRAADQLAEQITQELVNGAAITRYGQPGEPVQ